MKITRDKIIAAVSTWIQPLYRAKAVSSDQLQVQVKEKIPNTSLTPDGVAPDSNTRTLPFGISSGIPSNNVFQFFMNLLGQGNEPVSVGEWHTKRPSPIPGQTIIYATLVDGSSVPCRIELNPDGTIKVIATEFEAAAALIKLGDTLDDNAILAANLVQPYDNHQHIDSVAGITTVPTFLLSNFSGTILDPVAQFIELKGN